MQNKAIELNFEQRIHFSKIAETKKWRKYYSIDKYDCVNSVLFLPVIPLYLAVLIGYEEWPYSHFIFLAILISYFYLFAYLSELYDKFKHKKVRHFDLAVRNNDLETLVGWEFDELEKNKQDRNIWIKNRINQIENGTDEFTLAKKKLDTEIKEKAALIAKKYSILTNKYEFCSEKYLGRDFYKSEAWLAIRYEVLRENPHVCMLCGMRKGSMHVDHIKPRSKYPHLELEKSNLQILCRDCNLGKSNKFEDDFRPRK